MDQRRFTFERLLFGGLMLALTGCPGDDVPSSTSDGSTGGSDDSGSITNVTSVTNATTAVTDTDSADSSGGDTTAATDPTNGMTDSGATDSGATDSGGSTDTGATDSGGSTDTGGAVCGDDMAEGAEDCDGLDLAGADCVTEGFDGGVLACAGDCTFDTSACTMISCGNDLIEGMETCDGTDLAGEDCVSQGFAGGGALSCLGDCSDYDTSGCVGGPDLTCADEDIGGALGLAVTSGNTVGEDNDLDGSCGAAGGPDRTITFTAPADDDYNFDTLGSSFDTKLTVFTECDVASELACNDDAFPGNLSLVTVPLVAGQTVLVVVDGFNGATGDWVLNVSQGPFGPACGDGVLDAGEDCDGLDLGGETCATQGFLGGPLACDGACAFDTTGCVLAGMGDCCAANGSPGCDDAGCTTAICAADAFCCDTTWDQQCADEAVLEPACSGVGGSCPVPPVCEDQNIGSALGLAVASGDTTGADDDLAGSCGLASGPDEVVTFIAPSDGDYVFDTFGSGYDTKLSLFSDCATEISCNDDAVGLQSELTLAMTAGQSVLVVVDGFNGATGPWVLNIAQVLDLSCSEAVGVAPTSMGTNVGEDDDLTEGCGGGGGPETVVEYTAAVAGVHTFDAIGSDYDTVLAAFVDCAGAQIVCNDDFAGNPLCGGFACSQLDVDLSVGETVLISVAGFTGATGNWVLNVTEP
jgi:hypothetical protein